MLKIRMVAATALLSVSMLALAQEDPWSGKVGFGYLGQSGNTESDALNFDSELNWDGDRWHHNVIARAGGKNESGVTTSEAYKAAYQIDYDLTERVYTFGLLDYNKDRFSGYAEQIFELVGIGRHFIVSEKHNLRGQIGVGAAQSDPNPGPWENEASVRGSGEYEWKISENASFNQKLAVTYASSNTYVESVTQLRAGIIGNLGMALGYTVKYNTDVLPGIDDTDTWTTVNLDYEF